MLFVLSAKFSNAAHNFLACVNALLSVDPLVAVSLIKGVDIMIPPSIWASKLSVSICGF